VRHAIKTPRYVTVASWLVVTGVGLAIGAIGAGGLLDLLIGPEDDAAPAALAGSAPIASVAPTDGSGLAAGSDPKAGSGPKALEEGLVVSPSDVPDGVALTGRAPAPRVAQDKGYVAFEPTSIRLPSGRLAPIQPAKVHQDGALDVPQDPDRVGWWTGGAQAGEPYGSIVLAGHVDSADFGVGVLAEMIDMRPGENLKLADGKHGQTYRVETIRKVPKAKLAAGTDLFDQDLKHRLVMITCGGPFDPKTHRYRDNVVIVANPVG
jgi:sortase family protein